MKYILICCLVSCVVTIFAMKGWHSQPSVVQDSSEEITEDIPEEIEDTPEETTKEQIVASSWEDALEKSKKHNLNILLYFHASWCGPCHRMDTEVLSDEKVKEKMKNYVFLKLDHDLEPAMAHKFNINALPTFIICNESGKKQKYIFGFHSINSFIKFLE